MQGINETYLEENGWHSGVFKHMKLFSFPDPANPITFEAESYALQDFLRNSVRLIGSFINPSFKPDSLIPGVAACQWHSVQMNGQEYIAVVVVSYPTPLSESNVLIRTTGEDRGRMIFQAELKLLYDTERDVLLSKEIPDGAWIATAMARIQADTGTED